LEQIDLLGCDGLFQQPGAEVMAALGAPGRVEVRALLGEGNLFVVEEMAAAGGGPGHGHRHRTRRERN